MAIFSDSQRRNIPKEQLQRGSPVFVFKIPSIAASARLDYDFSSDSTYSILPTWLPMDFMQITNNSTVDVLIMINQDPNNTIYVPNGTIMKTTDVPITSLRIINQNSTTASTINLLQITLQKLPPDTNTFIRKIVNVLGVY